MNKLNSLKKITPFWLMSFWSVILFAGFLPVILQPGSVIGYLWKTEFALAALIFLALAVGLKFSGNKIDLKAIGKDELYFVVAPLTAFAVWSGLSCFWAEAGRNALHHTLLWACYVLFYILIREIVSRPKALDLSLKITGIAFATLGAACLLEYFTIAEEGRFYFTYRYYKFAEAFATLLPVFLALWLKSKSSAAKFYGALSVLSWFVVLASLSRTMFIASVAGVIVFFAFVFLFADWRAHLKKSALLLVIFAAVFAFTQGSGSVEKEDSTFGRFSGGKYSQASYGSRFLFWGIAVEAFRTNPLFGVGADNFTTVYAKARENYSARDQQNPLLEINETVLPERAHNEYLQILAELGVVGALLFAWFLFGILKAIWSARETKKQSLLTLGALAGIAVFFISSASSSYSFRVTSNGACFFFLLALAIYGSTKSKVTDSVVKTEKNGFFTFKFSFAAVGLIVCAAMMVFSGVRAASLRYLEVGFWAEDDSTAEKNFQTAALFDDQDPMLKCYSALRLHQQKRYDEAIPKMRFAIDKGIATSMTYFYLATAQIATKKRTSADETLSEALRVYPRSVFLLTFYADFLKKNGEDERAEIEFKKAFEINPEQAESWRIAQAEGMMALNKKHIDADGLKTVEAMDLQPTGAVFAVLDFQRQNNPNLLR